MPYYIGDLKRDPNLENHPHVKLGLGPLMQKHVHATPTCDLCLLIFACAGVGLCCGKMNFAINVLSETFRFFCTDSLHLGQFLPCSSPKALVITDLEAEARITSRLYSLGIPENSTSGCLMGFRGSGVGFGV